MVVSPYKQELVLHHQTQTHTIMKKLITSIAALLLFAGMSFAADNNSNIRNASADSEKNSNVSTSFVSARSLAAIIEENAELRLKVEDLTNQAEDLSSMLSYSKMMHATISNLQQEVIIQKDADTKSQLDYARMMNATIINLKDVLQANK